MVQDKKLRERKAKEGYKFAKNNFDWNVLSKKFIQEIETAYEKYKKRKGKLAGLNLVRVI